MNKKIGVIIAVVVAIVAFAGVYKLYGSLSEGYDAPVVDTTQADYVLHDSENSNEVTQPDFSAPDFTVYDTNGNKVQLSDYKGKPVVLNFWTSWCGYCIQEMPHFEEAYKNNPDIQFLMINVAVNDYRDEADEIIKNSGYTFPVVYDNDGDAAQSYQVNSFPQTVFIDKDGNIATYSSGMLAKEALDSRLALIK